MNLTFLLHVCVCFSVCVYNTVGYMGVDIASLLTLLVVTFVKVFINHHEEVVHHESLMKNILVFLVMKTK